MRSILHSKNLAMLVLLRLALVAVGLAMAGCAPMPPKPPESFSPSLAVLPPPRTYTDGAIFQSGYTTSLFENDTARNIGDILMVMLEESTRASKKQDTETTRDTSVGIENATLWGQTASADGNPFLSNSLKSGNSFKGEATSKQSNALNGSIAVTVIKIYANGLMQIQGEKWISINQGQEYIRLSGLVRTVDISPANTVSSTKLANAQIAYGGRGTLADANRQGWLSRFFNSAVWPF